MRKLLQILLCCVVLASCDKPGDCVKSTGKMASKTYDGLVFTKIIVRKGIGLVIAQGDEYKVEVRSGENLIGDIEVKLIGDMLSLEDNTTCNWVRDYGQTVVYITAPNLTDVYSKTEQPIISAGTLSYPDLHLYAMDSNDSYSGTGTSDFYLNIGGGNVSVGCNSVSRFYLSGQAQNLDVSFYASGGILYAQQLETENIHLYHRGSNEMYVYPQQSLTGDIYSLGNVYSVTHPPSVNVVEHYRGRLIFL
ncbi:head GIN domain-containing protein [Flavobacterium sp.]|uniref:head GIN domain-containing protein n=1 Tax=Flavobacterium sp. TaxID=239 RepID=UPI0039E653F9